MISPLCPSIENAAVPSASMALPARSSSAFQYFGAFGGREGSPGGPLDTKHLMQHAGAFERERHWRQVVKGIHRFSVLMYRARIVNQCTQILIW